MIGEIDAHTLKSWLSDGAEIVLIDVREAGQFGEAHPFFAIPLPYSRFELGLSALVPNPAVRMVLIDAGDGVAERAAKRAQDMGYGNLHILAGGAPAWGRAGYTLFAGVNVPSKTFGELVEHRRHTPRITALELQAMREGAENIVIVDGRTFAEFNRMNIPDGISCPNGELALRIREIAPDPKTRIVVNCAGRTRSIIGAQTLIDFGVPNDVVALENGTQGWFLAGLELEHGATRRYPEQVRSREAAGLAARARALAEKHGVPYVAPATAPRLALRRVADDLFSRRAHRRRDRRERPSGLRARPRRPAHPGDRSVGGSQRRAARARRRRARARAGGRRLDAPARS